MANELSIQLTFSANKTPTMLNIGQSYTLQMNISGGDFIQDTQTFTTTPSALAISPVTSVGYVCIRNTASAASLRSGVLIS